MITARFVSALSLALLLGGCETPPPPAPQASSEPTPSWALQERKRGEPVWRIDPHRSLITVIARRSGSLARLGHDHVVASRDVTGYVAPRAGRAEFYFRLDQMTVDEPDLRRRAGLDTQPDEQAIVGTRRNMLTRVLEADRFPYVVLLVEQTKPNEQTLRVSITLHGVTRSVDVAAQIDAGPTTISASGELSLRQTDFGMVPMSILGGAISVQDMLALQFHIVAVKPQ